MGASSSALARRRQATCNAILDATSEIIAEKGADGFTMTEVARLAKVNRALIYHYFKNRENLVFEAIRHIVNRYEEISPRTGDSALEQNIRLHIEHPEIARFIFHLALNGRPLPRLSRRTVAAIDDLQRMKGQRAPDSPFDPAFAIISSWLLQLSWSITRGEMARLLGMPVEEADRRFIAHLRFGAGLTSRAINAAAPGSA